MKFGARIFKTGISVLLALTIAALLGFEPYFMAGIAAAMGVFPSIHKSWKHLYQQILGNSIGAVVAICAYTLLGNHPLAIAFVVILVISINLSLKLHDTINLSVVVVIIIMSLPSENYLEFALIRVLLVLIGILSSVVVNFFFMPPKNEPAILSTIKALNKDMFLYLRFLSAENKEFIYQLKGDLKKLNGLVKKLDTKNNLFWDEYRASLKKKTFKEKKKLVIYKQIGTVSKVEYKLIKLLIDNSYIYSTVDSNVLKSIHDEILGVCSYHEKIFFKFERGIDSAQNFISSKDLLAKNKKLANDLVLAYKENAFEDWCDILPIVNELLNVAYELEKLERYVDNYLRKPVKADD